ncbi:MAG TPA: HEAT repeat domain-containing protein [Polyangiaceae bacterium]|nr:HEAT repeat domain-containing protein [Polyangiaceae bacterium]
MKKSPLRTALVTLALSLSVIPAGAQPTSELIQKLGDSADFRVRVQAALELGKTHGTASRLALEDALDDENAAVRAAAAAGLKVMRDPAALRALQRHEDDASAAVRAQIKTSEEALAGGSAPRAAAKPDVIVQVGKIHCGASATSGQVLEDVARTSKQKLRELPGVAVVEESKEPASRRDVPVVMVTGRVKQLEESREGSSVVYLASVEFVLHKMPGQSIKGVVSGSARASGAAGEMTSARMADLRKSALDAAIDSAVRRAPQALRAAAQ